MAKRDARPSVAEALEGHVTLDIECFDRMVFTAYVPLLQSGGGLVTFLRDHRGNPIPSPALFGPIGEAFRSAVRRFAEEQHVPLIPLRSRQDKLGTVRPHLDAAAAAEREGVVAVGVAQERRSVWMGAVDHRGPSGIPHYGFHRMERRITVYYFYLFDREWGPCSIRICSYAPYAAQLWCNGHERAKRQLLGRGIAFEPLRNGFRSCADPAALQRICDAIGPADVERLFRRWLERIPLPLTAVDRDAGYDWQLSMRQIEFSRTLVLDRPREGRAFFAEVARESLSLGGQAAIGFLFDRRIVRRGKRPTPGVFQTDISLQGVDPRISVFYRSSRIKEYLKEGRALRIETVCNDPGDLGVKRRVRHLGELKERARALNRRMLSFQRASTAPTLAASHFDEVALPDNRAGQRTVALRYGDPRVVALLGALCLVVHQLVPFRNADLRTAVEQLLLRPYGPAQMSYDLRRLRAKGLIRRIEGSHRYVTTETGTTVALLFTKSYQRFVHPLLAVNATDAPRATAPEVRHALRTIDRYIEDRAVEARLAA
ncbi:MAG: hypothetical protein KGK07_16820 [Chloroflexota bacterium]|nr:hypothetical protein [Chloroflexota bacterium]